MWQKLHGYSTPGDGIRGLQQDEKNDKLLTYLISVPFSKNRSEKCNCVLCIKEQKKFLCIRWKRKTSDDLYLFSKIGSWIKTCRSGIKKKEITFSVQSFFPSTLGATWIQTWEQKKEFGNYISPPQRRKGSAHNQWE